MSPRSLRHAGLCALGALAFGGLILDAACVPPAGGAFHLRVLATHDFHGALRPTTFDWSEGRLIGGAETLKTMMDSAEAECVCPTVRLDGGDQMQGTLESNLGKGESVVAAFNLMGLDAAAVGNHELDWGLETFLERKAEARYRWLAANVFRTDNGERPDWATPYAMVERGGIRVAVIGYMTLETPTTLRPDTTAGYEFRGGYQGVRDALEAVARERPDVTVIVAHAGWSCQADDCAGEMATLARELPPGVVQLIVGGHDHAESEGVASGIPMVRAGANGRALAIVDLERDAAGARSFTISRQIASPDEVPGDREMTALLQPYLDDADAVGRAPVATLAEPLSAASDRRLGHLVVDAERLAADADVGMHNPGGLRASLNAGDVSYGTLFRVLPFGNAVVRVTLTGRQLKEVVEQAGVRFYYSNLRIEQDPSAPRGRRVVSLTFADGSPVDEDRAYTLATIDFLADGGDGMTTLASLPREVVGVLSLDAVVEHLRSLPSPVRLAAEERVVTARRF